MQFHLRGPMMLECMSRATELAIQQCFRSAVVEEHEAFDSAQQADVCGLLVKGCGCGHQLIEEGNNIFIWDGEGLGE